MADDDADDRMLAKEALEESRVLNELHFVEDGDAVGVSILSDAHNTLCPRIVQLLREKGMDNVLVLVGGIVPQEDLPRLKEQGIAEVFLPGTSTEDIVKFLQDNVKPRE
jgi:methylmalonyl-CoA mutase C-terminal domain/subunit